MKGANVDLTDYPDATIFSLIEEVQKHKLLYDIPRKDRSASIEVQKRNSKWSDIGLTFGLPIDEVIGLWKKLRGSFVRYFKMYQTAKDSSKPYNPNNWKFFDSLLFLIPYVEYVGPQPEQTAHQSQSAASSIARKALKRSKNFLLKSKEGGDTGRMDFTYHPGGSSLLVDVPSLVEQVKQHPVLYAKPHYVKNSVEKTLAWRAISQELGIPARICLTKWMYLWRKLQVVVRKRQERNWMWFPLMEYFIPHLTTRTRLIHRSNVESHAAERSTDNEQGGFGDHSEDWNDGNPFVIEGVLTSGEEFSHPSEAIPVVCIFFSIFNIIRCTDILEVMLALYANLTCFGGQLTTNSVVIRAAHV